MSVLRRGSAQVGEMFPDWLEILMVYGCISSTYVPDELVKMHSALNWRRQFSIVVRVG
jgi:hypothetical protein